MKGYLMQDREWIPGEDLFLESLALENAFGVVFEDDGHAAYFYAVEKDKEGAGVQILDALHIHEADEGDEQPDEADEVDQLDEEEEQLEGEDPLEADAEDQGRAGAGKTAKKLQIVWSRDWLKCALVIDGHCHAVFDFEVHGGYNINEFPPPNEIWTQGERKLTDEIIQRLF
jgi:hypothetical protein